MQKMILGTVNKCAKTPVIILTNVSRLADIVGDERAHEIGEIFDFFSLLFGLAVGRGDGFARAGLAISIWSVSRGVVSIGGGAGTASRAPGRLRTDGSIGGRFISQSLLKSTQICAPSFFLGQEARHLQQRLHSTKAVLETLDVFGPAGCHLVGERVDVV